MPDRETVIEGLKHIQGLTSIQCLTFPKERMEFHKLINDALALLKEQEPVEAIDIIDEKYPVGDNNRYKGYRCGKCKEVIPWDANYCLYCGRKVKWDD